jgi:hypothetical protein
MIVQITRTLRQGMSGPDVRFLQELLMELGFFAGPADGFFGASTAQAVRAFQQSRGLRVDGIVGPQTRAALLSQPHPAPEPLDLWHLLELQPTPEATAARGVAAFSTALGQLHVFADHLPPPSTFGTRFVTYRAWLVAAARRPLVSIKLENCPTTETWVGSGGLAAPVAHAVAVVITAEPELATAPSGPEVLGALVATAIPVTSVSLSPTPVAHGATGFGFLSATHGTFLLFTSGMPDPASLGTDPGIGRVFNTYGTVLVDTVSSTRTFLGELRSCLPGAWVGLYRFEPVVADVAEVIAMVSGHMPPAFPVVVLRGVIAVPTKPLG